ncbi:MAG: hypothetical protein RLO22_10280 [Sneathiellaceae bacterium]
MGIQLSSKLPGLRRKACSAALGGATALALLSVALVPEGRAESISCPERGGAVIQGPRFGGTGTGAAQPDLEVNGICIVDELADFHYRNVNVVKGGRLIFLEPPQPADVTKNRTNFWASSIVIENGGSVEAGLAEHAKLPEELGSKWDKTWTPTGKAYGVNGNVVNILLYGADQSGGKLRDAAGNVINQGTGVACKQDRCGIDKDVWDKGTSELHTMPGAGAHEDYFYPYHTLQYDGAEHDRYFGYKVLALSYGGKLQLHGLKGTTGAEAADTDPTSSGSSWLRLGDHLKAGDDKIVLSQPVPAGWSKGDRIVVTATDYLPNHSEEFTIKEIDGSTITVEEKAKWMHNGKVFPLKGRLAKASGAFKESNKGSPLLEAGETRAGVALLTRSIRIVSGGDQSGERFDWESAAEKKAAGPDGKSATDRDPHYQFGAQFIARQGFEKLQVQGVEFRWMGQGGRIGHYPVHFHMARRVPDDTYIKDSSVNESMTRWYVLHATQGVTLQRNVGYKSIGHGYYLEDATETDNKLYSNIGIFARGGVVGPDNPRNVPGILSQRNEPSRTGNTDANIFIRGGESAGRLRSDVIYPTVFWMTNMWNDVVGNMAAGANACGTCFWMVPATDNANMSSMKWSGYAALQQRIPGGSDVKQFRKNYCSSAMHSLSVVASTSDCQLMDNRPGPNQLPRVEQVETSYAPPGNANKKADTYFPAIDSYRHAVKCTPSTKMNDAQDTCLTVRECSNDDPKTCATTVIDTYTTSFNWAETNFGAIWVRSGWNLVDRLFMSDILNGGIGMISGGDYTRSSIPLGYWAVLSHSVFVGQTQPGNSYAAPAGPTYPKGDKNEGLTLCRDRAPGVKHANFCIAETGNYGYPLSNWSTNRMINIYDGPFYQYANAFLDIQTSECSDDQKCFWMGTPGVRRVSNPKPGGPLLKEGYLPNAAIGWKQPNGFYYPPAFHSAELFFDNVDIRHYLTVPLFEYGSYKTDNEALNREFVDRGFGPYAKNREIFNNFTDVDRQTVLNDVDGTLTGFQKTISLNQDPFFAAPVQTSECLSAKGVLPGTACAPKKTVFTPTARTSPYDHVTTVVFPGCAEVEKPQNPDIRCGSQEWGGSWSRDCTTGNCTGVRLYRQYLTTDETGKNAREWQNWVDKGCDKPETAGTKECDKPFIRLAGTSTWQRSALTANNGTYYIDTSRSAKAQTESTAIIDTRPRAVSEFQANQTYNVFLLFAKNDAKANEITRQTYQIYVGPGFNPETGVKGIRVELPGSFKFKTVPFPAGWERKMIVGADGKTKDVLEVTMDFSKLGSGINLDPRTSGETCKPVSFCARPGEGKPCGCNLKAEEYAGSPGLKAACDQVCSTWAVKDLDFPEGGALGFSFTMTGNFKADDKNHRPAPQPFSRAPELSRWNSIAFTPIEKPVAGDKCFYKPAETPALGSSACAPSDWPLDN